jgi:hypothetical protein
MKSRWVCVALLLGLLVGCSRQAANQPSPPEDNSKERFQHLPPDVRELLEFLDNADEFELASLDPKHNDRNSEKTDYDCWRVLGRTPINDHETRTRLVNALLHGIEESGKGFKCFDPRHGIRAVRGGKILVFTICFGCGHVYVSPGKGHFTISGSPGDVFNQTLEKAGIPLEPQDDKTDH